MKHEHWFAARRPLYAATSFALAMLIGGCANLQDWADSIRDRAAGAPAAAGAPVVATERSAAGGRGDAGRMLADGIGRYEAGDYVGAIRTLNASEIAHADPKTRIEAEKYLAFSYCLTDRRALCREAFDRLFALDSGFRLQPAEAGHPLWGPVYVQARKAADRRAN